MTYYPNGQIRPYREPLVDQNGMILTPADQNDWYERTNWVNEDAVDYLLTMLPYQSDSYDGLTVSTHLNPMTGNPMLVHGPAPKIIGLHVDFLRDVAAWARSGIDIFGDCVTMHFSNGDLTYHLYALSSYPGADVFLGELLEED